MKAMIMLVLAVFAMSASAQAPAANKHKNVAPTLGAPADAKSCDLTWTYKAENAGKLEAVQSRTLYGMTAEETNRVQRRGDKVLEQGNKDADKGGPVTLTLGTKLVCDGKEVAPQAPKELELRGMTLKDANSFNRASNKIDVEMFDEIDAKHKSGKKRAFGKD